MQVRVFGLEEQSRMRGLDPKVVLSVRAMLSTVWGLVCATFKFPRAVLGCCFVRFEKR
jgi:hypothetical protein